VQSPLGVRVACIDIGSNTTRLLVADCIGGELREVHQERAFTRIGQGLAASGAIAPEKIDEVVAVVRAQMEVARSHGAEAIRGVATAAIRTASNGVVLVAAIAERAGLLVEIVSGKEEARLAFEGAAAMLDPETAAALDAGGTAAPLGVIDVGGGSSELVVGHAPDRVDWWASVALGSGALTEHCLHTDPPTAPELAAARSEVAAALAGLAPPCPRLAVAVGGSATSLGRVAGYLLDPPAFERALSVLTGERSAAVAARFEIDPQRARLLPAGLLILQGASRLLEATVRVGRGGIREGVLLEAVRP
jgi:exopolyphosphatase / guanosine-5'-triphosphate,3'-diphosphate pyrophosphatase